eukprot:7789180-Pyramimonas_sp.AAC.1
MSSNFSVATSAMNIGLPPPPTPPGDQRQHPGEAQPAALEAETHSCDGKKPWFHGKVVTRRAGPSAASDSGSWWMNISLNDSPRRPRQTRSDDIQEANTPKSTINKNFDFSDAVVQKTIVKDRGQRSLIGLG